MNATQVTQFVFVNNETCFCAGVSMLLLLSFTMQIYFCHYLSRPAPPPIVHVSEAKPLTEHV